MDTLDDALDRRTSLAAVAEALSHDIKGSIGTIGLQLRSAQGSFKALARDGVVSTISLNARSAEIERWIATISAIYDEATLITDAVRSDRIVERRALRKEIADRIATPLDNLLKSLDERIKLLRGSPGPDVLRDARLATFRVQRIVTGIDGELETDGALRFRMSNLARWAGRAVEQLEDKIAALDANISVSGSESVECDQNSIFTALINVIDNALTYVAPGTKPRIRISVEAVALSRLRRLHDEAFVRITAPPHWASISICDNGIGIPEDDHDQVFDMGFRVANELSIDGSGFGLFRVRSIIRRHRGRIVLDDAPGGGLCFRIYLPSDPKAVKISTS